MIPPISAVPMSQHNSCCSWYRRGHRAAKKPCRSSLCFLITITIITFLFVSQARGQGTDPVKSFCRRWGHQTAVIDRKLYIDGGQVNWNPISENEYNYTNEWLLFEDLASASASGMPALYANLSKNATIPDVSGGALWADDVNKRFYLYGGEYGDEGDVRDFLLYSYDVINDQWDSLGEPATGISNVAWGAGVAVSELGEGYYYGGWLTNLSDKEWDGPPLATTGLVQFKMDTNEWQNSTGPDDGLRRAEGVMVYIPAGDGGMLVYFGGIIDPGYMNGTYVGQPMDEILIYDVFSSKWYTQNTTGDAPGMRRRFCAGATWAQDHSSYNIYLYGGASVPPADTAGFDDVYILTLPTFTWIKIYPDDGNATGAYPHHSMTCDVVNGGSQMVIMGGTFPLSDDCDAPEQHGTHNLDLGEHVQAGRPWQLFDPSLTTYAVPERVRSVVGGSAGGGAATTTPAHGFDAPDLEVLMTRTASVVERTPTRDVAPGGGSSGPALSSGAIAGIVIGCVVGLLAILLAVLCLLRRRRRTKQQRQQQQQQQAFDAKASYQAYSHSQSHSDAGPYSPQSSHLTPGSPYPPPSPFSPQPQQPAEPVELDAATRQELEEPSSYASSGDLYPAPLQPRRSDPVWAPDHLFNQMHEGGGAGSPTTTGYTGSLPTRYSAVPSISPSGAPDSPQELSPHPGWGGPRWEDGGRRRPSQTRHTTYYHP